jgi:hypothetical protein
LYIRFFSEEICVCKKNYNVLSFSKNGKKNALPLIISDMFLTGSTTVTEPMPIPPSPKKEPRFKVPDLNPTKKEDTLIKECKEEVNNCKTS